MLMVLLISKVPVDKIKLMSGSELKLTIMGIRERKTVKESSVDHSIQTITEEKRL